MARKHGVPPVSEWRRLTTDESRLANVPRSWFVQVAGNGAVNLARSVKWSGTSKDGSPLLWAVTLPVRQVTAITRALHEFWARAQSSRGVYLTERDAGRIVACLKDAIAVVAPDTRRDLEWVLSRVER